MAVRLMKSVAGAGVWRPVLGATLLATALAGCEREVILQGERFDVRAPLDASIPTEAQPDPQAEDLAPVNESRPIALPAAGANADWTHRGGSARHAGPHGVLSAAPARVWSVSIGTGNSKRNRLTAAPVVAGARVFAMDARAQVSAVSTGGGLLWQTDLTAEFDKNASEVSGGGLAASGGNLYVTTAYGELVALDAATGALQWRQRFDAPVVGAPAVEGGTVYAVARDGTALAVDASNGKIRWQVGGTRSVSGMVGTGSPSVGDGLVVFPFASGEVAGLSEADGTRTWGGAVAGQRLGRAYAAGMGDLTGDPVISGGVVYIGSAAGRTAAFDATTGQRLWTANEGAMNPPLVTGGSVFVVNDEAKLVRLDAATGAVIWAVQMPYFKAEKPKRWKEITAHYGPVLAGGRVAVVSSDGGIRLFDPTDGNLVGSGEIPGGAASPAALAAGMLFVVGTGGQLHAFR
jgi:outer membrane protein assembly factor BamB